MQQNVCAMQGMLPCVTAEGKIIMASAGAMATAPDGNGGMYAALQRQAPLTSIMLRHHIAAAIVPTHASIYIAPRELLRLSQG